MVEIVNRNFLEEARSWKSTDLALLYVGDTVHGNPPGVATKYYPNLLPALPAGARPTCQRSMIILSLATCVWASPHLIHLRASSLKPSSTLVISYQDFSESLA